jgi:hypothetical protein
MAMCSPEYPPELISQPRNAIKNPTVLIISLR